jgi:hypothetical protein
MELSAPDLHISTLHSSYDWDLSAYERWPTGAEQLRRLSIVTRLDRSLQTPTQTGVLIMANLRECSDERALAIISAFGVTDWYRLQ